MSLLETTEILGNLGEFVGSVLVLGTLIYLAFQVKQAKKLLETSIALGRGAASREINGLRMNSIRLLELERQMAGLDQNAPDNTSLLIDELDCSENDAQLLGLWLYMAIRAIEVAHMTEGRTERSTLSILNVLVTYIHRRWWAASDHLFTDDFRQYVDDVLAEAQLTDVTKDA